MAVRFTFPEPEMLKVPLLVIPPPKLKVELFDVENEAVEGTVTRPLKVLVPVLLLSVMDPAPTSVVAPLTVKFASPTFNDPPVFITRLPPVLNVFPPKLRVVAPLIVHTGLVVIAIDEVLENRRVLLKVIPPVVAPVRIKVPVLVMSSLNVMLAEFDVLLNVPAFENVLPNVHGELETPMSSRNSPVDKIEKAPVKVSVPPELLSTKSPPREVVPDTVKLLAAIVRVVPLAVVRLPTVPIPATVEEVEEERSSSPVTDNALLNVTAPAVFVRFKSADAVTGPPNVTAPAPLMVCVPVIATVPAPDWLKVPAFDMPP